MKLSQALKRKATRLPFAIQRWAGVSTTDQLNLPSSGSTRDQGRRRYTTLSPGKSSTVSEGASREP
jgi:hypothetical protein